MTGCSISGNYNFERQDGIDSHRKELVLTYNGKLKDIDYKVKNKINFDELIPDKPSYYETSYEIYFW